MGLRRGSRFMNTSRRHEPGVARGHSEIAVALGCRPRSGWSARLGRDQPSPSPALALEVEVQLPPPEAEEPRARPAGAGDLPCDHGEGTVALTAPFDTVGMDEDRVGDPAPFPHEPRARL